MFYTLGATICRFLEKSQMIQKERKYKRRYSLDKSFDCRRLQVSFHGKGDIIGGKESYVGHGTAIQVSPGLHVKIGYRCRISHNVRIYTSSTKTNQDFTFRPLESHSGNVIIGDGVWVGANVVILPGVKIGDNVAIGANSIVNKDIPSNTVYAGAPAKFIKHNEPDHNDTGNRNAA